MAMVAMAAAAAAVALRGVAFEAAEAWAATRAMGTLAVVAAKEDMAAATAGAELHNRHNLTRTGKRHIRSPLRRHHNHRRLRACNRCCTTQVATVAGVAGQAVRGSTAAVEQMAVEQMAHAVASPENDVRHSQCNPIRMCTSQTQIRRRHRHSLRRSRACMCLCIELGSRVAMAADAGESVSRAAWAASEGRTDVRAGGAGRSQCSRCPRRRHRTQSPDRRRHTHRRLHASTPPCTCLAAPVAMVVAPWVLAALAARAASHGAGSTAATA